MAEIPFYRLGLSTVRNSVNPTHPLTARHWLSSRTAVFPLLAAALCSLGWLAPGSAAEGSGDRESDRDSTARPSRASSPQPSPTMDNGAQMLHPGALPGARPSPGLPQVFAPTRPRTVYTRFPWRRDITATVFWIGETPTANNPVPNTKSAWDQSWTENYGGFDDPDKEARKGYIPEKFTPEENPFYFALPYNDISRHGTKASARAVVPWFDKRFYRDGRTVLKGRWIAIRRDGKTCYAQWEDVGPFETDDWKYVFGKARPKTRENRSAGLDVSPAVRDYLEFDGGYGVCDWRFVEESEVPDGPWKKWGRNNPFARPSFTGSEEEESTPSNTSTDQEDESDSLAAAD